MSGVAGFLVQYHDIPQLQPPRISLGDMIPGVFVTCVYDARWYVGSVRDVSESFNDVEVQFMHPNGPANSFFWPTRDDLCWVPIQHIIGKITEPTTFTGRRYQISKKAADEANKFIETFK